MSYNQERLYYLENILSRVPLEEYPQNSRVHRLPSFDTDKLKSYIKREDELGFAANGSKLRKYLSAIPHIESLMPLEVALIGNPYSNHILSMTCLLKQKRIPYTVFLEGRREEKKVGNAFFSALITEEENIHWITQEGFSSMDEEAIQSHFEKKLNKKFFWVPMGAAFQPSFAGSLTLGIDIIRNEKNLQCHFTHIFIDAGTAMMAAALLLLFSFIQKNTHLHIVQMAGNQETFARQLQLCRSYFSELFYEEIETLCPHELCSPTLAPSFGSVNSSLFAFIAQIARTEGVFLDPLYNAKLFFACKKKLAFLEGNALFIHSGGALSLSGFQNHNRLQ